MTTLNVNGRARKNLADQLDRLDRILDGLADALDEAGASAVQQAVRGVLVELLNDPTIRAVLTASAAPAQSPVAATTRKRHYGAWLRRCWQELLGSIGALVRRCQ